MSKEKKKKDLSKKKLFIIIGAIVLVLVIGILLICSKFVSNSKTSSKNWDNDYLDFILNEVDKIKDNKSDFYNNSKDMSGFFIKNKDSNETYMIVENNLNSDKNENITGKSIVSYFHDKVTVIEGFPHINMDDPNRQDFEILYLYDNENEEANWYVVSTLYRENSPYSITLHKFSDEISFIKKSSNIVSKMYEKYGENYSNEEEFINAIKELNDEDYKLKVVFDLFNLKDNGYGLNEYTKRFINISDKIELNKFNFKIKDSKSDITKSFKDSVKKYKNENNSFDIIAKEIVEKENKKIEEILNKQTTDAYEANKKAEEEKKAQEEASKQTSSSSSNGINVGGMTVKYGTYNGDAAESGSTLVINSGGTCTYNGSACTYSVSKEDFGQDSSTAGSYKDCLNININGRSTCYMVSDGGSRINNGGFEFYYVG